MVKKQDGDVLPVTAARGRLFDLIEEILTGQRSCVELSHRSFDEHVVMVPKGHLEALYADIAALRAQVGIAPRPLRGLGILHEDLDQVLVDSRARQAELARLKRASFSSDEDAEA
ncbi:hypothetical protein [Longimicrobium sp.]|uniref:hypothetical protein n=1 Tax=Longimicrobium sp. TaxID=2029185 RepID=UPI003B3A460C